MKMRLRVSILLTIVSVFAMSALCPADAKTIWYVNVNATGSGTGSSWTNAFTTVDAGIAAASTTRDAQGHSDEVWVAEGVYYPPVAGGTSNGFLINKPIKIYGGFKGTESTVSGRKGSFLKTILDGDIGTPGTNTDNAVHVLNISIVAATSGDPGVVVDGFTIRNGYSGTGGTASGPGIYSVASDLDLANLFVRHNYRGGSSGDGGGLYFSSSNGGIYPTVADVLKVKNCEFLDNFGLRGGGMFCDEVKGEVVNTRILENTASEHGAGAYVTRMGSDTNNRLDFTNCVFWSNICTSGSTGPGAGLYLGADAGSGGSARVVNCTFSDNQGTSGVDGQAMVIDTNSQATIYNSIFYWNGSGGSGSPKPIDGSATIEYSLVEGGWGGSGSNIIDANPMFANHSLGSLTLLLSSNPPSPCLDAADYGRLPVDDLDVDGDGNLTEVMPLDVASQARLRDQSTISDTGVGTYTYLDMGAYELP